MAQVYDNRLAWATAASGPRQRLRCATASSPGRRSLAWAIAAQVPDGGLRKRRQAQVGQRRRLRWGNGGSRTRQRPAYTAPYPKPRQPALQQHRRGPRHSLVDGRDLDPLDPLRRYARPHGLTTACGLPPHAADSTDLCTTPCCMRPSGTARFRCPTERRPPPRRAPHQRTRPQPKSRRRRADAPSRRSGSSALRDGHKKTAGSAYHQLRAASDSRRRRRRYSRSSEPIVEASRQHLTVTERPPRSPP
ncbi:hypothetical protein SAMN05216188_1281 [Lentzea xinjiangensis]|uniref:Uncharacterized protein n=1 Tax=Lentzea xinjiangensis TaxID=402600 RepID=A0A1H9VTS4_9PSEU|nr:hypothetical protein SAMN05216188_1281 [Lentzea xinjiangensis]